MEKKNKDILMILIDRLKKIGVDIQLAGNYPWIYLDTVNGNKVKPEDYYLGNHGFTIAFLPKMGEDLKITDIKELFKVIRKYK